MGLDTVELVIKVEETFGIHIPDKDAQEITTVGQLVSYVQSAVRNDTEPTCATSHIFYRLRRELMKLLPLSRHEIRPDANMEALVPQRHRREVWKKLRLAGLKLPDLCISILVTSVASFAAMIVLVAIAVRCHYGLSLLAGIPILAIAYWGTRHLAVYVKCGSGTVRDVVWHLTPAGFAAEARPHWNENEIARKVRLIVHEQAGVPMEQLNDDTRFVHDLGMD
jgi:acyl carrier protein